MFLDSVRRLASRLQRDVVRLSVRRARKRARVEGQALLNDSLELNALPSSPEAFLESSPAAETAGAGATSVGVTPGAPAGVVSPDVTPHRVPGDVSCGASSESLSELPDEYKALSDAPEDSPKTPDAGKPARTPETPPEATSPVVQHRTDPRVSSIAFGGSVLTLSDLDAPRRIQNATLWRRRRLVCSAGDFDIGRDDEDNLEGPFEDVLENELQVFFFFNFSIVIPVN